MDPVGKGMAEVMEATVQHVRTTKKEMKRLMKTLPLDPFHMENEYTALSAELAKQLDREERAYQKVFLHAICGQGKMLNESNNMLDAIQDMGITPREYQRNVHHKVNIVNVPKEEYHPWDTIIQQTKLLEQDVPSFFQSEVAMKCMFLRRKCFRRQHAPPEIFTKILKDGERHSQRNWIHFERLNVKTDVWENTLDKAKVEILPGKVVMVKKPIGDGTHLKKGRVVVCGNFQQVQPGEETCGNTPSSPMLRTLISLVSLQQ